jgi:hypothetical protein
VIHKPKVRLIETAAESLDQWWTFAITPMFSFTKPRCLKAIPEKIQSGGHSTGKMARAFAGYVNAKVVLNHIDGWQEINP